MRFARSSVPGRLPGHGMPRVRDWPVWSLPPRLRAFVVLVICADLACTGVAAAAFRFSAASSRCSPRCWPAAPSRWS